MHRPHTEEMDSVSRMRILASLQNEESARAPNFCTSVAQAESSVEQETAYTDIKHDMRVIDIFDRNLGNNKIHSKICVSCFSQEQIEEVRQECKGYDKKTDVVEIEKSENNQHILRQMEDFSRAAVQASLGYVHPDFCVQQITSPDNCVYVTQKEFADYSGMVLGVFNTNQSAVEKDTILCHYVGEYKKDKLLHGSEERDFTYGLDCKNRDLEILGREKGETVYIDNTVYSNEAAYVNSYRGIDKEANVFCQKIHINNWPVILLMTTKKVAPGGQFLLDYGDKYSVTFYKTVACKQKKHRLYCTLENETPKKIARKNNVDAKKLLHMNTFRFPTLKMDSRLKKNTFLVVPGSEVKDD